MRINAHAAVDGWPQISHVRYVAASLGRGRHRRVSLVKSVDLTKRVVPNTDTRIRSGL